MTQEEPEPGGPRRSQEEPRSQKEPGGVGRSQVKPGRRARRNQEEHVARRSREELGGARSSHERGRPIKVARGGHDEPEGLEFVWLVLRKPGPIHPPPP